jgi:hypothetical protein
MPQLETSDQQVYESLFRFRRPQSLALHAIPQHQLLGIGVQIHLLVHPIGNRMPVQVVLKKKRGHPLLVSNRAVAKAHSQATEPESRNFQVTLSKFAFFPLLLMHIHTIVGGEAEKRCVCCDCLAWVGEPSYIRKVISVCHIWAACCASSSRSILSIK